MEQSIYSIFAENENNKLVLPDFQRDFEWKKENQQNLLASFFVGLPIGSLLLLSGDSDAYATKAMCFANVQVEPTQECNYLLDGQQRISTLRNAFTDFFANQDNWQTVWENMYSGLRFRWFIRVKPDSDEEDIFGWRKLRFSGTMKYEPSQVRDFFTAERIYKTKTNLWHNPGYMSEKKEKRMTDIAKAAASNHLIPLYTIYEATKRIEEGTSSKKALHESVIERIANTRIQDLQDECDDEEACSILEYVVPEIREIINDNPNADLSNAWNALAWSWSAEVKSFLNKILHQKIPIIQLPASEIGRAISIFENINRGGTPLDTFDLVVARAARDRELPSLSQRIAEELMKEIRLPSSLTNYLPSTAPKTWSPISIGAISDNSIEDKVKNHYLNLLSILCNSTYGDFNSIRRDHIKRGEILNLSHEQINGHTPKTLKGIVRAYAFLHLRCGIVSTKEMPYQLMLLPIAYTFVDNDNWQSIRVHNKVEYWYWVSLFSGRFREKQNDRCIEDLKHLNTWVNGNDKHIQSRFDRVLNEPGYSAEATLLGNEPEVTVPLAIANGIKQFILSTCPKDFQEEKNLTPWGVAEGSIIINDHHIYPLGNAKTIKESTKDLRKDKEHPLNSPLNRTVILQATNQALGSKHPAHYFQDISKTTRAGHFIPNLEANYKQPGESDEKYHERVLKARYQELKIGIQKKLEQLADSV